MKQELKDYLAWAKDEEDEKNLKLRYSRMLGSLRWLLHLASECCLKKTNPSQFQSWVNKQCKENHLLTSKMLLHFDRTFVYVTLEELLYLIRVMSKRLKVLKKKLKAAGKYTDFITED